MGKLAPHHRQGTVLLTQLPKVYLFGFILDEFAATQVRAVAIIPVYFHRSIWRNRNTAGRVRTSYRCLDDTFLNPSPPVVYIAKVGFTNSPVDSC